MSLGARAKRRESFIIMARNLMLIIARENRLRRRVTRSVGRTRKSGRRNVKIWHVINRMATALMNAVRGDGRHPVHGAVYQICIARPEAERCARRPPTSLNCCRRQYCLLPDKCPAIVRAAGRIIYPDSTTDLIRYLLGVHLKIMFIKFCTQLSR